MEGYGIGDLFLALLPQPSDNPLGMVLRPLVIVGVVEQAGNGPDFQVAAIFCGRRPHHDFDGSTE